jgi:hypothetical protein
MAANWKATLTVAGMREMWAEQPRLRPRRQPCRGLRFSTDRPTDRPSPSTKIKSSACVHREHSRHS